MLVEFDRAGCLPTTHESQGSDMGLFGGLLGWEAADPRLPGFGTALRGAGTRVRIETVDVGDPHPNTYRLTLTRDGQSHTLRAISTGGGMIEVVDIGGWSLSLHGDYHETLVVAGSRHQAADLVARIESLAGIAIDHATILDSAAGDLVRIQSQAPLPPAAVAAIEAGDRAARIHALAPVLPVRSRRGSSVPFSSAWLPRAAAAEHGTRSSSETRLLVRGVP